MVDSVNDVRKILLSSSWLLDCLTASSGEGVLTIMDEVLCRRYVHFTTTSSLSSSHFSSSRDDSASASEPAPLALLPQEPFVPKVVFMDEAPSIQALMSILEQCCSENSLLMLPQQYGSMLPLVSAVYDVLVAPLRILIKQLLVSPNAELPFQFKPSPTGAFRLLSQKLVVSFLEQFDPFWKLLLSSSSHPSVSIEIKWMGLYSSQTKENKMNSESLDIVIGISHENLWIFRSNDFRDWKKVAAAVRSCIDLYAPDKDSSSLVCALSTSDEITVKALESEYCSFTAAGTADESSMKEEIFANLHVNNKRSAQLECIQFRGNVSPSCEIKNSKEEFPSLLYLLAGQSNMSGRGRLSDLLYSPIFEHAKEIVAPDLHRGSPFIYECGDGDEETRVLLTEKYSERIRSFNVEKSQWQELDPMKLHSSVDYKRDARFGPGVTFATHLVELLEDNKVQLARNGLDPLVGLVPAAIGATYLEEWGAGFRNLDARGLPKCDSSQLLTVPDNANYQPKSNEGCYNLQSCALRSFFKALLTSCERQFKAHDRSDLNIASIRSLVGGVLWSQGCNDSIHIPESMKGVLTYRGDLAAQTYDKRFARTVKEFRWGIEGIVQMVFFRLVTEKLREKSESFDNLSGELSISSNVRSADGLHWPPVVCVAITASRPWMTNLSEVRRHLLTAPEYIPELLTVDSLGCPLKTDCVHLTTSGAMSLGYLLANAMFCLSWKQLPIENFPLRHIRELAAPRDLISHDAFRAAREEIESILDSHYSSMTKEQRQYNRKPYPALTANVNPTNLVYGEIDFLSITSIIRYIEMHHVRYGGKRFAQSKKRFVDLGCGAGVACAAAFLSGGFTGILGIDMMASKIETCKCLLRKLSQKTVDNEFLQSKAEFDEMLCLHHGSDMSHDVRARVETANFLEYCWDDWNVVYMASTMFVDEQMQKIYQKTRELPKCAYLILLDKQLPNTVDDDGITKFSFDCFELIMSCQCVVTWGSAMAYVYHKYS